MNWYSEEVLEKLNRERLLHSSIRKRFKDTFDIMDGGYLRDVSDEISLGVADYATLGIWWGLVKLTDMLPNVREGSFADKFIRWAVIMPLIALRVTLSSALTLAVSPLVLTFHAGAQVYKGCAALLNWTKNKLSRESDSSLHQGGDYEPRKEGSFYTNEEPVIYSSTQRGVGSPVSVQHVDGVKYSEDEPTYTTGMTYRSGAS